MAKIILPYTIQNGNTADGGQVQQDFDAILTQVNGNLDSTNLASGAVTLTKLASDVKVIENIYSVALSASVSVPNTTETEVLSQSITLSTARYCLFLITADYGVLINKNFSWTHYLYDGTTKLVTFYNGFQNGSTATGSTETTSTFHYYAQLASGSHTIYYKPYQNSGSSLSVFAPTRMTIIQFAF